jgi:NADPH:quinone reductase-like Zn-dependent oxidoreductase
VTVLGNEFAGQIEAVGPGATSFRVATGCLDTTGVHSVPMLNTW